MSALRTNHHRLIVLHFTQSRGACRSCSATEPPDRAAEFRKLPDGVTDDELDRVKAALKTSLVMQQESTGARAGSMAGDWFNLGRVRTVDEIRTAIDGLTVAAVADHARRFPADSLTVVTLGPEPLTPPV